MHKVGHAHINHLQENASNGSSSIPIWYENVLENRN